MQTLSTPEIICTQEVRFAIVMYGGVSLAIYINGIAQELLHMVRSTARDATGDRALLFDSAAGTGAPNAGGPLSATERVYRKLSYLLANPDLLNEYREFLKSGPAKDQPAADDQQVPAAEEKNISRKLDKILAENSEAINTRFVVDIMSGTSAGGINSIYLAKAMANDQPIDQLKNLWLNEGDIALLINDKESVAGLQMGNQNPPQSLLNSRRMYLMLLKSFDDMESKKASAATFVSPYVDELDLYITATDLAGLTVPIRLSDSVVYEKRHRHVFHFKYSTLETSEDKAATGGGGTVNAAEPNLRNDFLGSNNPFLAFAARCTSSFPFAFEPMKLCDIDDVLKTFSGYRDRDELAAQKKTWTSFFKENLDPDTRRKKIAFEERPFGDGGYLDNKPFSYTTEMLMRRDAPVPVDRKLIYIEPSPEHPEDQTDEPTSFDALQNVKAALLELPTYETIREDLEKVIQRNTLIGRVNRITAAIERDLDQTGLHRPRLRGGEWQTFDLADMVNRFGIYYLPYRRLRISGATDELAKIVARIAGLDENSADFHAIRVLIRAWREINYRDYHKNRLRTDTVDELADRLASAAMPRGADGKAADPAEDAARRAEILSQLRTWVQINCSDYYTKKDPPAPAISDTSSETPGLTANQFLIDYDFQYWLRRLTFIRGKLDQLYRINRTLLRKNPGDLSGLTQDQKAIITRIENLPYRPFKYSQLTKADRGKLQTLLEYLKFDLSDVYRTLRAEGRKIQSAPRGDEAAGEKTFHQIVKEIKIEPALISYLLGLPRETLGEEPQFSKLNEDECVTRARKLLEPEEHESESADAVTFKAPDLARSLQSAAAALKTEFAKAITDPAEPASIWSRCCALLDPRRDLPTGNVRWGKPMPASPHANSIREYLWRYLTQFDDFDQVRFPILFGTDVGESDVVEIIRISPEDAPSLISERSSTEKRRKLAGTSLFHFGGFLDRTWRENDIMWGRLDGAERLITSLLPDAEYEGEHIDNSKVRAALIEEAQTAILLDEFPRESRKALGKLMTDALTQASAGDELVDAINKVVNSVKRESPTMKPLQQVMLNTLSDENLLKFMKEGYEVNRKLDAKSMLRALSRSTQVIGSIFEGIANTNGLDGKNLAWIARLGKIFWGLVEVAVPDSIIHLLFTHWLKLLYLFEALLLIGGTVLVIPAIQQLGLLTFALTLATNLAVFFLHDEMEGKRGRFRILKVLAIVLGIILFLIGLVAFAGVLGVQPIWRWMSRLNGWFTQPSVWRRWSPAVLGLVLFLAAIRDDLRLVWGKYTRWLSAFKGEPYGG